MFKVLPNQTGITFLGDSRNVLKEKKIKTLT